MVYVYEESSSLLALTPFMDTDDLLRLLGRSRKAPMPFEEAT